MDLFPWKPIQNKPPLTKVLFIDSWFPHLATRCQGCRGVMFFRQEPKGKLPKALCSGVSIDGLGGGGGGGGGGGVCNVRGLV